MTVRELIVALLEQPLGATVYIARDAELAEAREERAEADRDCAHWDTEYHLAVERAEKAEAEVTQLRAERSRGGLVVDVDARHVEDALGLVRRLLEEDSFERSYVDAARAALDRLLAVLKEQAEQIERLQTVIRDHWSPSQAQAILESISASSVSEASRLLTEQDAESEAAIERFEEQTLASFDALSRQQMLGVDEMYMVSSRLMEALSVYVQEGPPTAATGELGSPPEVDSLRAALWRLERGAGANTYTADVHDAKVELDARDPILDDADLAEFDDRFRYLVEFMQREKITRLEVTR